MLAKDGGNFVWVVDQPASTVSLHKVDLAGDPAGASVASGLAPGARIVTAGVHSLEQGQHVRIERRAAVKSFNLSEWALEHARWSGTS